MNQDHQWKDSNAWGFSSTGLFQSSDQWQKEMNRPNSPREEVPGRYLWEAESRKKDIVCLVLTPKLTQKILQSSLSQSVVDPGTLCRWVLGPATCWNSSQGCCLLCLQRLVGGDCSEFAQEVKKLATFQSPLQPLTHSLRPRFTNPVAQLTYESCLCLTSPPRGQSLEFEERLSHKYTRKRKQGGGLEVEDGYSLLLSPAPALSEEGNPPQASLFTSVLNVAVPCFVWHAAMTAEFLSPLFLPLLSKQPAWLLKERGAWSTIKQESWQSGLGDNTACTILPQLAIHLCYLRKGAQPLCWEIKQGQLQ